MSYKIVQKRSPNQSDRRGWKPDMIVSHITEGSYAGAVSWLCNPASQASSHFVVSQKGEITQLVPLEKMAWVNGTSTDRSKNNFYGNSKLKTVRDRKTNANYYTIGIEHEGISSKTGGRLTPEQFKATVWLHQYIIKEVKRIYGVDIPMDREHLVGHFEIDPIRKAECPGKNFQWDELIKELKGGNNMATPNTPQNHEPSAWAKDAWIWAIKEKIIDGTNPKNPVTREQLATILYRLYLQGKLK